MLRKLQDPTKHEQVLYFKNLIEDKKGHPFLMILLHCFLKFIFLNKKIKLDQIKKGI